MEVACGVDDYCLFLLLAPLCNTFGVPRIRVRLRYLLSPVALRSRKQQSREDIRI